MGGCLFLMAAVCALGSGLGLARYLSGDYLRAISLLFIPLYLAYWAWQEHDSCDGNLFLVKIFAIAYLAGLPLGAAAFGLRQLIS